MAPGTCKIRPGCSVFQVPIPNPTTGGTKEGEPAPPWWIKIMMACILNKLREESQTVGNRPLYYSSPTLNPTYLPIVEFRKKPI